MKLPENIKRPQGTYTAEQIEAGRKIAMANNTICSVDCEICGGIGFVKYDDGKVRPCPNVDPYRIYPAERYGIRDNERGLNWGGLKTIPGQDLTQAIRSIQNLLKRGAGWIYLWGDVGTAKTLLLKIAIAESLRKRRMAAYTRMAEIMDDLRQAFDRTDPSESSQRRLEWWSDIPVLAIDEFSRVKESEYAIERRFLLMDRRYESAVSGHTITIMAGNEDPAHFESYLWDRIRDGRFAVEHITGKSARPGMGW